MPYICNVHHNKSSSFLFIAEVIIKICEQIWVKTMISRTQTHTHKKNAIRFISSVRMQWYKLRNWAFFCRLVSISIWLCRFSMQPTKWQDELSYAPKINRNHRATREKKVSFFLFSVLCCLVKLCFQCVIFVQSILLLSINFFCFCHFVSRSYIF